MKKSHKKQIAVSIMMVALCAAIYLNWQLTESTNGLTLDSLTGNDKNYGEAEYVSTDDSEGEEETAETSASVSDEYFLQAKTNRTKSRDEALEMLETSLKDADITADEKENLTASLSYLVSAIESESKMESLIKAKGVEDCIVYINNDKCDIVLKGTEADGTLVNQIKDIVVRESGIQAENITISETK